MASTLRSRRRPEAESHYEDVFFDVVAFGDLADYAMRSLAIGDQVTVFGQLDDRDVSDQGDAQPWGKVVATEIEVNLGRLSSASRPWCAGRPVGVNRNAAVTSVRETYV